MVLWRRITSFLVVGYLSFGRSFAYLGVPPLFIGEIVLAGFLVVKPRVALGTWVNSLLRASPLNALSLTLFVFIAYGVWEVGRGVLGGSAMFYTLKFFVFNYYTLYMFLGIWIGLQNPDYLPKLVRVIAWVNGLYGFMYILVLRHLDIHLPGYGGTDVALFSAPVGQVVAILGLLCFERDLRAVWFVLVLNILVTLVWQVRAEWLGLGLGIFVWGLLTGRIGRVFAVGMAALLVLGMIELAGIELPGRSGDGVSLSENLARVIAPINLELAQQLSPNAKYHAGTAEWRELWWEQIWPLRAFHTDARSVRAWIWLRFVWLGARVGPSGPGGLGGSNTAQRLLLCPRLHGMGRGRSVRSSAHRHSQTPVAVVSGRRRAGRDRLVDHGHGQSVL